MIAINVDNKREYTSSIVLLGNFSPGMFQPYWFKYCSILDDTEMEEIKKHKSQLVSEPITLFETDNLLFDIKANKFTLMAKAEPFELMLDVFGKLCENIGTVLLDKFGINYTSLTLLELYEV